MSLTHLQGRMPHGQVLDIVEFLLQSSSPIKPKQSHLAKETHGFQMKMDRMERVASDIVKLIKDFRSTLPRQMDKQHRRTRGQKRSKDWKPFGQAQQELGEQLRPDELGWTNRTLQDVLDFKGDFYSGIYSAFNTLIIHDKVEVIYDMIDHGVDLKRFMKQGGTVGSGIEALVMDLVKLYVWLNQVLLLAPTKDKPYLPTLAELYALDKSSISMMTLAQFVGVQAARALVEAGHAYDNHNYQLYQFLLTEDQQNDVPAIRNFVKNHVFPQLVRLSHVYLYNEIVHNRIDQGISYPQAAEWEPRPQLFDRLLADQEISTAMDKAIEHDILWWVFKDSFPTKRQRDAFCKRFSDNHGG